MELSPITAKRETMSRRQPGESFRPEGNQIAAMLEVLLCFLATIDSKIWWRTVILSKLVLADEKRILGKLIKGDKFLY
jgi:hypothetical protein